MVLFYIGITCILILLAIYYKLQSKYDYWTKQKVRVAGPKPIPIFGNYKDYILMRKLIIKNVDDICKQFPNEPYIGAYIGTEPTLIVQDLELLKLVLIKDFYYFNGREITDHSDKEIITRNMFFTYGNKWKIVRQNLRPMFSSLKMKNMFHLIEKCAFVLEDLLDKEIKIDNVVEVRSLTARFTIDCVGACAFGVDTNVMLDNKNNPFRSIADAVFSSSYNAGFRYVGRAVYPALFYTLGFQTFPQIINDFFKKLITGVFKERNYKPSPRSDFVDLILNFKNQNYITGDAIENMKHETDDKKRVVTIKVDDDLLVAQCMLFFAAGFETSSTTLGFTLYELAKKPELQERAYKEVVDYLKRNNNIVGYSCVTELPYLEACIDETLRLYPVLGTLTREVMEDYTLPDGVFLKKGTRVHIPVYTIQRKEEFYPNPLQFDPERFFGDKKRDIPPCTYLPFGEGPRTCLGMRFAKMQMLAGLVTIMKKYKMELSKETPLEIDFEPKSLVTQPVGGIKLKFITREGWESRVYNKN